MAIAIETNAPARIVEIDGQNVAFDTQDLAMARVHADKVGMKGPLKKEDLIDWFKADQPFYNIPEPAEKKTKVTKDDNGDVIAHLHYHKITSKGSLGKTEYTEPVTRGQVRAVRGQLRGRPSAANMLAAVVDRIESDWSPTAIIDQTSNVYAISKDEDGKYTAARDKSGTESILRARLQELESQLEKYQNELDERGDSE